MGRKPSQTPAEIAEKAMAHIWRHGFGLSSMDDLVLATGSNRQAIYAAFGDKDGLLIACLHAYSDLVVTPAFARVESPQATLSDIDAYFAHQIAAAEAMRLPGPGCLMANTMTEVAPHRVAVAAIVRAHLSRLHRGFLGALRNARAWDAHPPDRALNDLAGSLVIFANGLWSASRLTTDAGALRRQVKINLKGVRHALDSMGT